MLGRKCARRRTGRIERGSQTCHRPAIAALRGQLPCTDPRTGRRLGFTYFGNATAPTSWTFSRGFQEMTPPSCPPAEAVATDCGTQGPFPVPVNIGWRAGFLEFRGLLNRRFHRSPNFESCEYEAYHELSLLDSRGRLAQRRLARGPRTMRVELSRRLNERAAEGDGSQTTTFAATVTLRRLR
jgi:hypothetical protein